MDPSIIKFLEDDEDESMHSGADVEAFTAALNRDIEGDMSSLNQSSCPETGALSKGTNSVSQNLLGQWQASGKGNNFALQIQHQGETPHLSQRESMYHLTSDENQHQAQKQHECNQLLLQPENCLIDQQQQQQTVAVPLQLVDNNQIDSSEQNSTHCLILDGAQHPQNQKHNEQQLNRQQLHTVAQANNSMKRIMPAPISFFQLVQKLEPYVDNDRYMQLQALYTKLKAQEVTKENFLRVCKCIAGDQVMRQVLHQLQTQLHPQAAHQAKQNQLSSQIQVPSHQSHIQGSTDQMKPDASFSTIDNNSQNPQETDNRIELKEMRVTQSSSYIGYANNPEGEIPKVPLQTVKKPLQQMQLPQSSFSVYGSTSNFHAHPYSSPCVGAAVTSLKSQTQTSQMRQAPLTQGMLSTKLGTAQPMTVMNVPRCELQNAANETKKLHSGSFSHLTSQQQKPVAWPLANIPNKEQRSSGFPLISCVKQEIFDQDSQPQSKTQFRVSQSSSIGSVHNDQANANVGPVKYERQEVETTKVGFSTSNSTPQSTQVSGPGAIQAGPAAQMQIRNLSVIPGGTMLPRKPLIGQKKPLEVQGSSSSQSSKRQKTSGSGALLDQSIEQLNDVTAVSGVNLREEEEQLLSTPKEDSRASDETRRFVQEEEDRLILQKEPLQKKLLELMSKCGIERIGSDVERCLSMSVEERLRGLICNMIRFSKQRTDIEKSWHRFVLTSDIKRQILVMNQKAKEEWEKKQAEEAERLRKDNETEGNTGVDADKDEGRSKTHKTNREEDDTMRTTAANVAARAAVGGDDMLSKWQLMAEQARQKREGMLDEALSYQQGRTAIGKPSTNVGRTSSEQAGKRGPTASICGGMRILGRRSGAMSHPEVERVISTKDLIAILEREPQMSRSTLIYRLYNKMGRARQQNIPI